MLHALKEYAEAVGLESEPGFKPKEVKWLIIFDDQGHYINSQRLGDGKAGELIDRCPHLTQPELKGGGTGCRHFLVDGLDVASLLVSKGEPDEKLLQKHAYFRSLLEQAAIVDGHIKAVHSGLSDAEALTRIRADVSSQTPKAKPADLATFAVVSSDSCSLPVIIVKTDSWHDWWRQFRLILGTSKTQKSGKKSAGGRQLCFINGETIVPASTHPPIEGLSSVGGLPQGDVYASFKQESFQSYGLTQSSNAAMSEDAAKMYCTALNHLIRERSVRLAGSRIAYWYSGVAAIPESLDPVQMVLGGFEASAFQSGDDDDSVPSDIDPRQRLQAEHSARSLLDSIRMADRKDLLNAEFRAMTISANSGRVVIRDWMEGKLVEFAQKVDEWFDDLRIVRRDGLGMARAPKFLAVLAGTVRDLKDITSPAEVALWQAAVRGSRIPGHLAAQALSRFRIDVIQDRPTSHAQVGLLKAFCIRQSKWRISNMTKASTELNESTDDPAYVAGRILAMLGQIQKKANPGVNVSVVERYYAAASTSPALILGRLIRMTLIAHLPKIKPEKLQRWFDNQLASLIAILKTSPKATLTMEEQTLFALGYYQQRAHRFEKEKPDESAE
jgi:CRISPR-associated protein Csd1